MSLVHMRFNILTMIYPCYRSQDYCRIDLYFFVHISMNMRSKNCVMDLTKVCNFVHRHMSHEKVKANPYN